jgi:hypothetical protein
MNEMTFGKTKPVQREEIILTPKQQRAVDEWWISEAARAAHDSTAHTRPKVGAVLIRRPLGYPHDMVLARAHNGQMPAGLQAMERPGNLQGATLYISGSDDAATIKAAYAYKLAAVITSGPDGPCTRTLLHMSLKDQR